VTYTEIFITYMYFSIAYGVFAGVNNLKKQCDEIQIDTPNMKLMNRLMISLVWPVAFGVWLGGMPQ
jgi:hypothetical protein